MPSDAEWASREESRPRPRMWEWTPMRSIFVRSLLPNGFLISAMAGGGRRRAAEEKNGGDEWKRNETKELWKYDCASRNGNQGFKARRKENVIGFGFVGRIRFAKLIHWKYAYITL